MDQNLMQGGLPCMNCQKPVNNVEGKVFAGVFVCTTCHTLAERMYQRLEGELKRLLLLSKEAIRIALVEGKMAVEEGTTQELSKAELLRMIVKLSEQKK